MLLYIFLNNFNEFAILRFEKIRLRVYTFDKLVPMHFLSLILYEIQYLDSIAANQAFSTMNLSAPSRGHFDNHLGALSFSIGANSSLALTSAILS